MLQKMVLEPVLEHGDWCEGWRQTHVPSRLYGHFQDEDQTCHGGTRDATRRLLWQDALPWQLAEYMPALHPRLAAQLQQVQKGGHLGCRDGRHPTSPEGMLPPVCWEPMPD